MPAYANTSPPSSIGPGDSQDVWTTGDGNLVSATKTQRVALTTGAAAWRGRLSLEVAFSGAPGVLSLQLQTADTDADADYASEGAAIVAVSAGNVARAEYVNVAARFARVLATTVTNAVTARVTVTA